MKFNKWTVGLAALGVVSLTPAVRADETPKPSAVQTALSNTTISGYVSASANVGLTGKYDASPAINIPFQSTKANGFNLDVVKLTIAKPEDATPWAAGYNVDLLFGPDAVGYNSTVGSANADYGIKQAYVTLNAPVGNGLDFKVGVFDSPLGYEVFDAGSNPNYTRSWGYYVEPTELTGLMATYKVNDSISFAGGVANASSAGVNARNNYSNGGTFRNDTWHKAYFGTLTVTAPSSLGFLAGSTAFAGVLYGSVDTATTPTPSGKYMGGNQVNYYGGLSLNTPIKEFTTGVAFDYVRNYGGGIEFPVTQDTDVLAVGLYGTYKASDKLTFSGRGEYVEADNFTKDKYTDSQNLVSLTGTVEYDLWANVISRVEARWDQNLSTSSGTILGTSERQAVGLYANIIYKF